MEEITFCIAAGFGAADNLVTTDWARANFGGAAEMACLALAAVWVAAAILATTLPNFTIFFASFFDLGAYFLFNFPKANIWVKTICALVLLMARLRILSFLEGIYY
jgi:hypothetical protein